MANDSNNSAMLFGLIVLVVFLVAVPVGYFIMKEHRQAPARPAVNVQVAPKIVAPPPAPPVYPSGVVHDLYLRGWSDAHRHANPDPAFCQDPHYRLGYSDFCRQHRPGFRFSFSVGR